MKAMHLVITAVVVVIVVIIAVMLTHAPSVGHATRTVHVGLVTLPASASEIIVVSNAFGNGSSIPQIYTCNGANVSIPLSWSNVPSNTKSILIIMEDLNAPGGPFLHWVVYNIPPNVTGLPQGLPNTPYVPGIGYQGINDFGKVGYGGPCPPPGSAHEYVILVIALNTTLPLGPGISGHDVIDSVGVNDIVGYGVLIGYYG